MRSNHWFGDWLTSPVVCRGIRLVIEQMSERAEGHGVASLDVTTDPPSAARRREAWGFVFEQPVTVTAFRHQNISDTTWVRRARVEVFTQDWRSHAPSRLLDAFHRQPCRFDCEIEEFESSRVPSEWVDRYYHDFFLRTIESCAPGSGWPEGLSASHLIASAAWPAFFNGCWNPGDSGAFNPLIAAILQPAFAIENQKLFPDLIKRFGFMPGVMERGKSSAESFLADYSSIIWGPGCYWDLWSWTRDREFLRWFTEAAAQWSRWYLSNRDRNRDGWLEPGVNGCRIAEDGSYVGLHRPLPAWALAIFECPWDDGPVYTRGRCRDFHFDPATCSTNIHFIETQLYNAGLADFCAKAFAELGDPSQATEFARQARRLEGLVRDHCWDERSGFYYDRDVETGRLRTETMHAGGFYPMLHGLPSTTQARHMVSHLLDPAKFWTAYPVPTLSQDSPDYAPTHYWSGRAWPPVNFHILRGLLRYGFLDVADQLLDRWMQVMTGCFDRPKDGTFEYGAEDATQESRDNRRAHMPDCEVVSPENWNPETSEVQGSPGLTWGGLWLPAVIERNFQPDGEHHALLRPGGYLRFRQRNRWDVEIDETRATVNGHRVDLHPHKTTRLNCRDGACQV